LEGYDGRGNPGGLLAGYELAWLKNRYQAFMIHVQGSAILQLQDGTQMAVGYAANTDHGFVGFTKECLKHKPRSLSVKDYFINNPKQLDRCLAKNNRFIFFKQNPTPYPIGSLGVPVIPECSIATDKKVMPPGALSLIRAQIPYLGSDGSVKLQRTSRFVLDQDTGGAIKGPGRVDIFMGTGDVAARKAHHVYSNGELYYLILRDETDQRALLTPDPLTFRLPGHSDMPLAPDLLHVYFVQH
jgi:membrane-bound lytic murein transglycosylase A